jgi:magnesium transporter
MSRKRTRNLIADALNPLHTVRVMGRLVRRSVRKPGAAPGTLVAPSPKVERVRLRSFDYDADRWEENDRATVEECLVLKDLPSVSWVNVDGLHDLELVRRLGEFFNLHLLVLEDITTPGQRAKVEEYDRYVYVVLPMLSWNEERRHVVEEQLSLVLGPNYVLTFQERYGDIFAEVRERIRTDGSRLRQRGADYLAYALMDAAVDHYYQVLEAVGERTEALEERVLLDPDEETMKELHHLKRELLVVRRAIWPLREMLSSLQRSENGLMTERTRVFLRDVYDNAVQVLDSVESLRDVVSGLVDLYLSTVSFRTNEVMKVLTVMASIFIPLTFLAGIYGMNFQHMPELTHPWAYPALLGIMGVVALGMLWFFRRKGWL